MLLDGAHNPGARALSAALLEEFVVDRRTLRARLPGRQGHPGILRELAPATGRLIVTANRNPRAAPAERLRKEARSSACNAEVAPTWPPPSAGRSTAPPSEVVVTGSLHTVGEARDLLLAGGPA